MKAETIKENGFKETEMGPIPNDWDVKDLGALLKILRNGITKTQNKNGEGMPISRIETISTGEINIRKVGFIDGLTKEEIARYRLEKGDILFSHINSEPYLGNTAIYQGIPTVLIHGMNLLAMRVKEESIASSFLNFLFNYYRAKGIFIAIASRAVNQSSINQGKIKAIPIVLPLIFEQHKISSVLSKIQRAIGQQEKIIMTTRRLKKSLMNKIFSEGLHGEERKESEIGLIPESWGVESIMNIVEKAKMIDPTKNPNVSFKYIDVSGISNEYFRIVDCKTYKGSDAPSRARKLINKDDVIFATVRPTLKRIAFVEESFEGEVCSTAFCVLRSRKDVLSSRYLYYCVQRDEFIEELAKLERGASYPAVTDNNIKDQKISLPKFEEQTEIATIFLNVDKKIQQAESGKQTLQALFKTMLNQLMTGKVRVKNFDIEVN
jgi:type I restriction enzyme S subunit